MPGIYLRFWGKKIKNKNKDNYTKYKPKIQKLYKNNIIKI